MQNVSRDYKSSLGKCSLSPSGWAGPACWTPQLWAGAKPLLQLTALQVWLCPALLNLLSSPHSHPLSALWREGNPLPYNCNNEVIGSHDKNLAGSRSALHREVRQAEIWREGLGIIYQLAQGISFWFTSAVRKGKRKEGDERRRPNISWSLARGFIYRASG